MAIEVHSQELPPIGTQCYLLANPDRREFAVFDAPQSAWEVAQAYILRTGYRLTGLYLTHGHWDHTLDATRFNAAGVPCHAHAGDRLLYESPEVMAAFTMPGLKIPAVKVDVWLEQGQEIEVAGRPVEVRHVPGHSLGSLLFWFKQDNLAIAGDAIFCGGVGRTDFPGCSFALLESSIRNRIYTLPDATILYPGHGPETTVGDEALDNPFVRRGGSP